jgi:hypothetical protein
MALVALFLPEMEITVAFLLEFSASVAVVVVPPEVFSVPEKSEQARNEFSKIPLLQKFQIVLASAPFGPNLAHFQGLNSTIVGRIYQIGWDRIPFEEIDLP